MENSNDEIQYGGEKDGIKSRGKWFEVKNEKTEVVMDVNDSGAMTLRRRREIR